MPTKRQEIIETIASRLSIITTDNGYQTNIGQAIYRGFIEESITNSQFIVLFDNRETLDEAQGGGQSSQIKVTLFLSITAYVDRAKTNTHDLPRLAIGDIQRALFEEELFKDLFVIYENSIIDPIQETASFKIPAQVNIHIKYTLHLDNPFS